MGSGATKCAHIFIAGVAQSSITAGVERACEDPAKLCNMSCRYWLSKYLQDMRFGKCLASYLGRTSRAM